MATEQMTRETTRAAKETTEAAGDFYSRAFKSWANTFGSFGRAWAPREETGRMGMESWLQPWWSYMDYWARWSSGFGEWARMMQIPFESTRYYTEAWARGIDMYRRYYEAWTRSTDRLARLGTEVGRQLYSGDKPDPNRFFDTLREAYNEWSQGIVDSMGDTPFAGVKDIDQAIKRGMDSFPGEQHAAKDFLRLWFDFSIEAIKLSNRAWTEATRAFSEMMEKGTLSPESYGGMLENYSQTMKRGIEVIRPSSALFPGYTRVIDNFVEWAKGNVDVSTCWLDVNLRLQKAASDSYTAMYRAGQEFFGDGSATGATPDEMFRRWSGAYGKAASTFVDSSQVFTAVPQLVEQYTRCAQSTFGLWRDTMVPPFASREDLERVSEDLEKAKSQAEKAARPRPKSTSETTT